MVVHHYLLPYLPFLQKKVFTKNKTAIHLQKIKKLKDFFFIVVDNKERVIRMNTLLAVFKKLTIYQIYSFMMFCI